MKWLAAVFCLLFVYAALMQFNDPDPARWIAIYTLGALTSGLSAVRRCPVWLSFVSVAAFGLWALVMSPAIGYFRVESVTEMSKGIVSDEEAREALGLLIGTCLSTILLIWNRSASGSRAAPSTSAISEHHT